MTLTRRAPLRRKRPTPRRRAEPACAACPATHAPIVVSETEAYCWPDGKRVADELASAIVRRRDPMCVDGCGRPTTDAAHVEVRGHYAIRWIIGETTETPGNVVGLHRICHTTWGNGDDWKAFVDTRWPGLRTDLRHVEAWALASRTRVDVADVIRKLRERAA